MLISATLSTAFMALLLTRALIFNFQHASQLMNHKLSFSPPFLAVVLTIALGQSPPAIAYSDVEGSTVWFTEISETSPTGDPLPLHGQPIANGDVLEFTTTANFSAVSTSGGPANQTDGKLFLTIESKSGVFIEQLDFEELGLLVLNAPFGGDSFASVLAFAEVDVLEVDDLPVMSTPATHFFTFAPDSSFLHSADASGPSFATPWVGDLSVTLPDDVTKLMLTIDTHIYAATVGVGTGALIDFKTFEISVTTEGMVVPEPAAAILGLLGLNVLLNLRPPRRD